MFAKIRSDLQYLGRGWAVVLAFWILGGFFVGWILAGAWIAATAVVGVVAIRRRKVREARGAYYDGRIGTVLRYRTEPPPQSEWSTSSGSWRSFVNSITGFRLVVTDEAIEVLGLRRLARLMLFAPTLTLPTTRTTVWTVALGRMARWPVRHFVALSYTQPDGSEYTLAVRPSDGDLDRLKSALKSAGAHEG